MGRLTRDPEVRYSTGENPLAIARYTLAVDRRFRRDGEQSADFISCVAFGRAAEFAEKYQNTHFTINEYWDLGHVANLVNFNGANVINVTLTDDALWMVTGTSLISSLTIYGNGQIIVPEDITLTVNGTEYTGCTITAATLAG